MSDVTSHPPDHGGRTRAGPCARLLEILASWSAPTSGTLDFLARKARRNLRDYGWRITLKKGITYLFGFVFTNRTYRIHRVNLETWRQEPTPATDCVFKMLKAEDGWAIEQVEEQAEWYKGKLRNSIAAGGLCCVALQQREVVALNIIKFGEVWIPLVNVRKRFRPHQAWSDYILVRPDFRRRGLGTRLRYEVFDELRRRGVRHLYAGALLNNVASLQSAGRAGYYDVAKIHYLRLLGFRTWRYDRVRGQRRTGTIGEPSRWKAFDIPGQV